MPSLLKDDLWCEVIAVAVRAYVPLPSGFLNTSSISSKETPVAGGGPNAISIDCLKGCWSKIGNAIVQ